jgi:beta-1,4-mannosyl-glycoprotein beta-1,4-N-acetylglucosaminyltransferase
MTRVFDCFPFFNELDLLEIRLHELAPAVDRFVLAEATTTYSGEPKPLYFSENRQRFSAFADRIAHIVIDDAPRVVRSPWERRTHQVNALVRGLGAAGPDDLVILSDVDEIPRADVVRAAAANPPGRFDVHCFELRMFYYYVNLESEERWLRSGPRAVQRRFLNGMERLRKVKGASSGGFRDLFRSLHAWRMMGRPVRRITVPDAGWHFTYLGGVEAIHEKIRAYAGYDKVSDEILDPARLNERIRMGLTVDTRRETRVIFRPLDDSFPRYLIENREKFARFVLDASDISGF